MLLKDYLMNYLDFPDAKLLETKGLPIERESFEIRGVPKGVLLGKIVNFFILRGYYVSSHKKWNSTFELKEADKLVAFFVFTPSSGGGEYCSLVTVELFNEK